MIKAGDIWQLGRGVGFYLVVGLIGIALVWSLIFLVPRQQQEVGSLLEKRRDVADEITGLSKALAVLKSVDQKKLATQLATVNAALPSQKKTSGLLSGVAEVARGSGVTLKSVDFAPGKISTGSAERTTEEKLPGTKVSVLLASAVVTGDLSSLRSFLTLLSSSSQLVGVKSVAYTGFAAREQTASLSLLVYFQQPETTGLDWSQVSAVSSEQEKVVAKLSTRDVFILPPEQH